MKYLLIMIANNGETVKLPYETMKEALEMKSLFMLMGQYLDANVIALNETEEY